MITVDVIKSYGWVILAPEENEDENNTCVTDESKCNGCCSDKER